MRTKETTLARALFAKTRLNVLALLLNHADASFYLREIARATRGGIGAVQRELRHLAEAGILERTVRGQQVYYKANDSCPVFAELQSLLVKTAGVADVLRAALAKLDEQIRVAFLYGSFAHGTPTTASDIDVMVIGNVSFAQTVAALAPTQKRLGREVNPSVYPPAEFRHKLRDGHHFLNSVLREPKAFLVGDEHELKRLAQGRLAEGAPDQQTRNRRSARRGRS